MLCLTLHPVIGASNPAPFNTGLLNQSSPNSNAPIPIARIIDSTDGDIGPLALIPGVSMGLAEYSSANFFRDACQTCLTLLTSCPSIKLISLLLTTITDPLNYTTTLTFDLFGNLATVQKRNGVTHYRIHPSLQLSQPSHAPSPADRSSAREFPGSR